jgi:hypothetical protein
MRPQLGECRIGMSSPGDVVSEAIVSVSMRNIYFTGHNESDGFHG